ncbi:FAD-dependent oxidoreductase [Salinicola sp. V024]|uniref:FAD-dependent oxidoreductase n=1 Tax=Salinicola sp. V024 TaxID=3459609 RepID=UPI0040451312
MSERTVGEDVAVTLYGLAGNAEGYDIRDYLSRTLVPFEWVRLSSEAECVERLGLSNVGELRFPIVDIAGQERLFAPDLKAIAAGLGRITLPRYREYDVSIYGAGPAGLSAAVYAASEGLRTVLIERHAAGGQAGTS